MKKSIVFPVLSALVICIAAVCMDCGNKSNGNPVSGGNSDQTYTMTGTYRATSDSIFLAFAGTADTFRYCTTNSLGNDSLATQIDTLSSQGESGTAYTLSGNTLTVTSTSNSFMNDSGPWLIAQNTMLTRIGSGSGLEGVWKYASISYSVISGILPDSVRHNLDSTVAATNQSIASGEISFQLTFSGARCTITYKLNVPSAWADYYISDWTNCSLGYSADTCTYAIIVTKVNDNTVSLHGIKSNETVTIARNEAGDLTYTSSDASHPPSTYIANPTSCPDPYEPDWYYTFLSANSKSGTVLTKRAVPPVPVRNHERRSMLKNLIRF